MNFTSCVTHFDNEIVNVSLTLSGNKANFSGELFETIHQAEFMVNLKISTLGENNYMEIIKRPINVCNFLKYPISGFGFDKCVPRSIKIRVPG